MKYRTSALLAAVLLACILAPAAALEIEQGRMRLTLHEDNGRFSIYYLENIREDEYTPLLFNRDPRTSSLGLLLDNRIVTLGSSSDFEQEVKEEVEGASFVWENSRFEIRERFRFIRSSEEKLTDGVRIDITVSNVSGAARKVGVHYLFDTYLGERGNVHYTTSTGDTLTRETEYTGSVPDWWLSPAGEQHAFEGLRTVMDGGDLTPPDRIVFANWKRLNESTWNMQVQEERKYNLLPYSVNDSAACHFYEPELLQPGDSRTVSLILGTGSGYTVTAEDSETEQKDSAVEELTKKKGTDDKKPVSLEERLIRVNDLLKTIDKLLAAEEELTREKVEILEQSLQELKELEEPKGSSADDSGSR
jgi:hypothetical protein